MGHLARRLMLVAVGTTGCFIKPDGPQAIDGGGGGSGACASYSSWSQPQALHLLNTTTSRELSPALSGDNRRLVFSRFVTYPLLWEATWDDGLQTFTSPVEISYASWGRSYDGGSFLSYDGKTLWFQNYKSAMDADIWSIQRPTVDSDFDPGTLAQLLPFGTLAAETSISFSESMLEAAVTMNQSEIGLSSRTSVDELFLPPQINTSLSSAIYDCCASLSADGRMILWEGQEPDYGIWQATRLGDAFETKMKFAPLNDAWAPRNTDPHLSYDGTRLVYASDRSGTQDNDLYMLTRECLD